MHVIWIRIWFAAFGYASWTHIHCAVPAYVKWTELVNVRWTYSRTHPCYIAQYLSMLGGGTPIYIAECLSVAYDAPH